MALHHRARTKALSEAPHWFKDVKNDPMAELAKLVCTPTGERLVAKW
jgi:hypothetical protein